MLKVAVSGALGRMGRLTCDTVNAAPDLQYVGGLAQTRVPEQRIDDDLGRLLLSERPDVLVDFTPRPVSQGVARAAVEQGVRVVIGSSEWNEYERAALAQHCSEHRVGALLVPNFAIGAVLMMQFAQTAARYFPTVEIVEMHRADKRDKPSGTAAATAQRIRTHGGPQDVPIHSVRLQGALAHQEVLLGNTGEILTIRHDSLSRESFAAGILFAIRSVCGLDGLQVGLDGLINGGGGEP